MIPAILTLLAGVAVPALLPAALWGQVTPSSSPQVTISAEEAVDAARNQQRAFERDRRRWSPVSRHYSGSRCDERIGRLCLRYDEGGDWWPAEDDPRLAVARDGLLDSLAVATRRAPKSAWVLGQLVAYLGEAGRWTEAEEFARACSVVESWWCAGLLGFVLHAKGRYTEAEKAFRRALDTTESAERERWLDPEVLLDAAGRDVLDDTRDLGHASEKRLLALLWSFADPLYLVEGNDRLTEHWARWMLARVREDARNPYAMSWGRDLEELLVRYGPEAGWERSGERPGVLEVSESMVGHHHPESRVYLPPGEVLRTPAAVESGQWRSRVRRPRSGYAPPYAPVIIPARGEVLAFPAGDSVSLIGIYGLPEDTTHHSSHEHPPFEPPELWRDTPFEAGLFLVPLSGAPISEARTIGKAQGSVLLSVAAGEYVASLEVWDPSGGLAGRLRQSFVLAPSPPDVPRLSDLLLLDRLLPDSPTVQDAASHARLADALAPGEAVIVGWQVYGLGWRPQEVLSYRLTLVASGSGFFGKVGRWLGLGADDEPRHLSWEEPGPGSPGAVWRSAVLELPELESGDYTLRLELASLGRGTLVRERAVSIRD